MTEFFPTTQSGLPDPKDAPQFYRRVPSKRLLAWAIDTGLIILIVMALVVSSFFVGAFFIGLLVLGVHLVYRIVSITRHSATPGMRFAGVELRNHRGEKFTQREAVIHTLAYTVVVAAMITQLINIVLIITSSKSQGLHDYLLGSTAINRPED